jgi:hypothetical protein
MPKSVCSRVVFMVPGHAAARGEVLFGTEAAQKLIHAHQHPEDCSDKKFVVRCCCVSVRVVVCPSVRWLACPSVRPCSCRCCCLSSMPPWHHPHVSVHLQVHASRYGGFGSQLHMMGAVLATAMNMDRCEGMGVTYRCEGMEFAHLADGWTGHSSYACDAMCVNGIDTRHRCHVSACSNATALQHPPVALQFVAVQRTTTIPGHWRLLPRLSIFSHTCRGTLQG